MDRAEIVAAVDSFFKEEVEEAGQVDESTDLIDGGILDSMMMVMLISHCEETLDIELDVEDLTEENFRTVGAIVEMIDTKQVDP